MVEVQLRCVSGWTCECNHGIMKHVAALPGVCREEGCDCGAFIAKMVWTVGLAKE